MNKHLLENKFQQSLETAKYKVGEVLSVLWQDEIAWARIEGISERAGELVYNVKLLCVGDLEYENNPDVGIQTWIFPSMIIKVN